MKEDKIRQQARKIINEKYPYLPLKEWGYFEDMFINGWKEALIIQRVSQQRELLIGLLTKLENGGGSAFIDKEQIVDDYLKAN